jgi:hypothetical protein
MATLYKNRVGYTRKKLAEKLNAKFPNYHFEPEDLWSQIPVYASAHWDCCSWGGIGYGKDNPNRSLQVHSWHKMREFTKKGVEILLVGGFDYLGTELCPSTGQPLENAAAVDTIPPPAKSAEVSL